MTATITNKKSCSGSVEAGKTRLTTEWKPESQVPQYVKNELSKPHPNYILAFLNVVQQLKIQRRTGYLDLGIKECESISDHMYRLGIITMLIKVLGLATEYIDRIGARYRRIFSWRYYSS
ncbi:CPS_HP_G0102070.mRNA.1.CDS.1 [Saccharomyces cerevisiae]|nr:CPS_HP_G0102070.mRNA.1.CDS.1 [Saccharomyces cerevisiae]CAI6948257.1 CPS_HP_G0102070.mRNA.1.CDS.1 [Saccharomyces cerevisiae]